MMVWQGATFEDCHCGGEAIVVRYVRNMSGARCRINGHHAAIPTPDDALPSSWKGIGLRLAIEWNDYVKETKTNE